MARQLPRDTYREIYESLKGFRRNKAGELLIPNFTNEDYEELVSQILVILEPVIAGDFSGFIAKVHYEYLKWYSRQRMDLLQVRPRYDENPNIKQLLTLLKHYVYRRTYSNY